MLQHCLAAACVLTAVVCAAQPTPARDFWDALQADADLSSFVSVATVGGLAGTLGNPSLKVRAIDGRTLLDTPHANAACSLLAQ
jgi:hypothetical protein